MVEAEFVDSGKVHQGFITFGIAVALQCTVRYRRCLQVKLNVMLNCLVIGFGIWERNMDFMFLMRPF
jgi:hypothetical protein